MPEGMESVLALIIPHFSDPKVEPSDESMSDYRSKNAVVITSLKERSISSDIVVSNYASQNRDGTYGAQQRASIISSKRNLLLSFIGLDSFSFVQLDQNTRNTLVFQPADISPADQPFQIYIVESLWHEA